MTTRLTPFLRRPGNDGVFPSMEELLRCVAGPGEPVARAYLEAHPGLKASLEQIVGCGGEHGKEEARLAPVPRSREELEVAAYYRWEERRRGGYAPDGTDWEDWFAAERTFGNQRRSA